MYITFNINIITYFILSIIQYSHHLNYEGECFCNRVQNISKRCDVYYSTIEYFPVDNVTRDLTFCLNDSPTSSSSLFIKNTETNTTHMNYTYIPDLNYIGDCLCYKLHITNPTACNLYLITAFNNRQRDQLTACLVLLTPPISKTTVAQNATESYPSSNLSTRPIITTNVTTTHAYITQVHIFIYFKFIITIINHHHQQIPLTFSLSLQVVANAVKFPVQRTKTVN